MKNLRKFIAITSREYLNEQHYINAKVYKVFYGTNNNFDSIDYDKIGIKTESAWNGVGFYFSENKAEAS